MGTGGGWGTRYILEKQSLKTLNKVNTPWPDSQHGNKTVKA